MSKVMEFIDSFGKIEYKINKKGILKLEIEAIARGLGFVEAERTRKSTATSGGTGFKHQPEVIRWKRINKYLKEFGYDKEVHFGSFIPENMFYRLAMKAKSENAQKFQAWIADEVIPSIRKHGAYFDVNHPKIRQLSIDTYDDFRRAIARLIRAYRFKLPKDAEDYIYGILMSYANTVSDIPDGGRPDAETEKLLDLINAQTAGITAIEYGIERRDDIWEIVQNCKNAMDNRVGILKVYIEE